MENECDSQEAVSMERSINISTFAEIPSSKSDGKPSKLSPTPPSNSHEHTSMDVINESVDVCLKTDKFHNAVNVVSTDKPISHQQSERLNSSLKTPTKHADQEQNLPCDKLARVCDSMNKLMSLCTPMKDLRTQSWTPINPFRCENVGNESQKIVLDFPTSLLDVSIGMLESMTTMMAPLESASSVSHLDGHNIASDLITVAQVSSYSMFLFLEI